MIQDFFRNLLWLEKLMIFLLLITVGCSKSIPTVEAIPISLVEARDAYEERLPRVALIPFVDSSEAYLRWDVVKELTQGICRKMVDTGKMAILSEEATEDMLWDLERCDFIRNVDLTYSFHDLADYVIILELVGHSVLPFAKAPVSPAFPAVAYRTESVLQIKVRLKIVDIHGEIPLTIVEELFVNNLHLPSGKSIDYEKYGWQTEQSFWTTPWGKAHASLFCDLANYIGKAICNE